MPDESQQSTEDECGAIYVHAIRCKLPKGHDGNHKHPHLVSWPDHVSEGHDHTS